MLRAAATLGVSLPYAKAYSTLFSKAEQQKLQTIAKFVLPSALGEKGHHQIVDTFAEYVQKYRPGADTEHGYGKTHVTPKGQSPFSTYQLQLASLPATMTLADLKAFIVKNDMKELPRVPSGKNVVVDLMAFYFRSSAANDLCYESSIGRDECRGLHGSENVPKPLVKGKNAR